MSHNQILLLVLLIFGGTICSLLVFVFLTASEDKKMRTNFKHTARERISMFEKDLEENLHTLDWLGNLYKSSEKIGRLEFREFVWPYLQSHPEVQALGWATRVLDSERKEYFPVSVVEPYKGNIAAMGFDLLIRYTYTGSDPGITFQYNDLEYASPSPGTDSTPHWVDLIPGTHGIKHTRAGSTYSSDMFANIPAEIGGASVMEDTAEGWAWVAP